MLKRNLHAYRGTNRDFIKIKFKEEDRIDGFYIIMVSGAVLHGIAENVFFIPRDAQSLLINEGIGYEELP